MGINYRDKVLLYVIFIRRSRNALDEECRAQKALDLLEARDRRIAYLEKRVAELEETAIGMHTMSLRASSTLSSFDEPTYKDVAFYSVTQSEQSIKFENDNKNHESSSVERKDLRRYDKIQRISNDRTTIPELKLSSRTSNTDKEIFSTPVLDMTYRKSAPNCRYSDGNDIVTNEMRSRSIESDNVRDYVNDGSKIGNKKGSTFVFNADVRNRTTSKKDRAKFRRRMYEEITHTIRPKSRNRSTVFPSGVSSSVAWMRTKRNFRKKNRPFAARVRRQQKGDQRAEKIDVSSFR